MTTLVNFDACFCLFHVPAPVLQQQLANFVVFLDESGDRLYRLDAVVLINAIACKILIVMDSVFFRVFYWGRL